MREESERDIRLRLGVPVGADRVLVFAESSHWDPDWLLTSSEYYSLRIRRILVRVMKELLKNPRRVFSIESVFFFKMYWDKNPDGRETIRALVNEGRLRFSGTGYTQPDTMIPSTEAIIRDFQMGQQWLSENGMDTEPRVAYMTDDFGLSPAFPSILNALGMEYTAASRIDGHFFPGAEYDIPWRYPIPGSTAQLMLEELKTTDVVWRAEDGSEVIFHLNPKTYDQGRNIALAGIARWMGIPVGLPLRCERYVAGRIASIVRALLPLSRTPYMFCPMGGDFNGPVTDLVELLDRYNSERYPGTGVYAVLGCLEDYMDLLSWHRAELPLVTIDPNPNFMGFYYSRPKLKRGCRTLVSSLLMAEKLGFRAELETGSSPEVEEKIAASWETAVVTNHHDFITGTSPDRVLQKEQMPWVREANRLASEVIEESAARLRLPLRELQPETDSSSLEWSLEAGVLRVASDYYAVEIDERRGGCITSFIDRTGGKGALAGLGNDLVLYEDSGGLWRMGCEFPGGRFEELARASGAQAALSLSEHDGVLEVSINPSSGQVPMTRLMWFDGRSPVIWMRTAGSLGEYRTITCSFATTAARGMLSMDVAGGVVDRPLVKVYDPTFWSAQSFVHYRNDGDGPGIALFTEMPATVCGRPSGALEWVVARNARRERAFGFLPLLAFPASGPDRSIQVTDYAVCLTGPGDWRANRLHLLARELSDSPWRDGRLSAIRECAEGAVEIDDPDVSVTAIKHASRGAGWVVRLFSYAAEPTTVRLRADRAIRKAVLCDARERDLEEASVEEGAAVIPVARNITSVRLIL